LGIYNKQQFENTQRIRNIEGTTFVDLEICRVEEIDSEAMTLTVSRLSNSTMLRNIRFCTPMRYLDNGIFIMPEVGTLCVLATTRRQELFVISFLSYSTLKDTGEVLEPGEIMLQSVGEGFIKLDGSGRVVISSSSGSFIRFDKDVIVEDSLALTSRTAAREILSGSIDGVIQDIEKYYNASVSSDVSLDQLVGKILSGYDVDVDVPTPVLIIKKGNVLKDNGDPDSLTSPALPAPVNACWSLEVFNTSTGISACKLMIGVDGSIQLVANRVLLKCNEMDLTEVVAMKPDFSKWDSYDDTYEGTH